MQFKDIVGQPDAKQRLIRSVRDGRMAHAQLIGGPAGTGKLALAIAYAQYIACQRRTDQDSCGECPACRKHGKLIHPDLHFVFPVNASGDEGPSARVSDTFLAQWRAALLNDPYITEAQWYATLGLENKQGVISASESAEVIKKLSLKSFEAEYKMMIIWLPERMNLASANKLLKLIEEPPDKTIFLMVSEQPMMLLKTILSRTQLIRVYPLPPEAIAQALVERFGLQPQRAQEVARVANGSFQRAVQLVGEEGVNPYFEMFRELMRCCYANNINGLLDWAERAARLGRERQKEMLAYALGLVRESFMLNLGLARISYLAGEEADFGQKFAPFIHGANVPAMTHELNLAIEHIGRNGNAHIVFTDMTMRLVKLVNRQ